MSMLEETQSAGDGYKTPTSMAFKESFSGENSDQFALAVLRLQQGLEDTNSRILRVENQLKQNLQSIKKLENQTKVKSSGFAESRGQPSAHSLIGVVRSIDWFYWSYPFLVYFVIRALERRDRKSTR